MHALSAPRFSLFFFSPFFSPFLSLSLVVSTSMPKSTPLGCVIENISSGRPVRKGFVFRAKARPKCQRMGHPPSGHSLGPVRFTHFKFYCYTHAYPAAPSILSAFVDKGVKSLSIQRLGPCGWMPWSYMTTTTPPLACSPPDYTHTTVAPSPA